MKEVNFLEKYQKATKRDYVQRVVEHDKAECAEIARQWGYDYWDGDRRFGYGGYSYDGRWAPIARDMIDFYDLKAGNRVLDVGCGKAFLIYEMQQALPGLVVTGLDISEYGLNDAKPELSGHLVMADATEIPFPDNSFDFVFSINTLHNLGASGLDRAFREIERVGKDRKWICVESFRNEREKANLLYWQLTCRSFHTPEDWRWLAERSGYTGDLGYIFFE